MDSVTRFLRRWVASGIDKAPSAAPAPLLMPLEPRIVYDASVAAVGAAAHHQHNLPEPAPAAHRTTSESSAHSFNAPATRVPAPTEHVASAPSSQEVGAPARRSQPAHLRLARTQTVDTSNAQQVVFIDADVANYQSLVAGLPPGTPCVVLNASTDGLQQIAQYLQQHPGVSSIHLVSHGADGEIQVGNTWLNKGDLSAYSAELAQIGAAMRPGGDFLIYGCDVAQQADGQALVQQIASISHLNVAASINATGAAALGGDWVLEYTAGSVHTQAPFSKTAEQQFSGLLSVTNETYNGPIGYDTPGGATGVTSFTLDGITYTLDQAAEFAVDSTTVNQFGPPPLSTGPTDGVLFGNVQGTSLTSMTMTLQNGDKMVVQSFDIDINAPSQVAVEALDGSGNVIGTRTLDTSLNGGSSVFHVDLSSNTSFSGIKSLRFTETDGAFLTPTLNNFTYVDLSSPPAMTASGGSTSFVEADNTASTPVVIDSGVTLTDGDATTAKQGTVSITGNFASGQDVLGFTNTNAAVYGDISAAYNATTGILTLTSTSGTATITQWQNAFRAVTYTDTAVAPSTATRTVSFELTSDAYLSSSNTVTKNVTVTGTDQTPIVTTTGSTRTYSDKASAVTIDSGITVSDRDNTTQSSGTVSVTGGFHSGDTLSFTNDGSTMGNISGSYNAATGVLTLTSAGATATDAQWQHALSAVMFSSTSTTLGNRTISFATSDGTKTSTAATDTVSVVNPLQVTTDSGSASFVAADNATSTPVAVDSGLTVSDAATSTLSSATVAITGGFTSGEDVLSFTNNGSTMGNIAGSYNAATGVLTLTSSGSTATVAQWQSALEAVKYTDTAVTPNSATRTMSFTATDSLGNTSSTATRTVTVTDTDQTPIVTTTGSTTSYVGASSAVTIDGSITVSDLDNTTQSSGTVSVSGGFHSGDTLSFTNDGSTMGNIVGSYNAATGVLTLTSSGATATTSQWANALSAVAFSSTSTTYGNRTISFATSDGTKTSAARTDTINMTAPPKITTDSGSASFVAGDNTASTPVVVDSGLTVIDGSATTLGSTTVAVTGGFHSGEDVLSFTNDGATMGNITGSYNSATGVLTLTSSGATATLAQWQSALQSVTYTDTAVTPNTSTRTISFTSVDGAGNTSATATRTVTITDTDQTPIVTTTGGMTSYVGASSAVTIDGGISVIDRDNTTQTSGTVSVSGGFHSGDSLSFTNNGSTMGNITGSFNAATGVLTLTSAGATATDAQWTSALSAVTFSSTSTTYGNRTISFATSDGTKTSTAATDTVNITAPPKITTDSGSASFIAGDNVTSTPVAIDSGLTVTDGSATTLGTTTVAITGGFHSAEDVLAFTNDGSTMGNISGSYNSATGVLTLTSSGASATLAQWQSALQSVTYTDTAVTPTNTTRTISFTSVDGAGNTSATATRTVTITDTDQTPIVTTTGGTANYVGGTSAVTIDGGISVSDLDNTTQSVGTVAITGGLHSGDTLTFINTSSVTFGNIAASYNAATGVLTMTSSGGTATDAQWANALSAVTFSAGSSATPGNRTVSFTVNDGTKTSAIRTDTVAVLGPPTITTDSGSASFIAGDNTASTPVAIDPGLSLTDSTSPTLASATVAITGNFHIGEDVLGFTNTSSATYGNIAASYNATTGVLTLTSSGATATPAQWQAALDAVTYTNTVITPNSTTRTISFTVVDTGAFTSNTATRTVTVTDTDQTPIVSATGGTTNYVVGTSAVTIDGAVTVSDSDNSTQSVGIVAITTGFQSDDALSFTNTSSTTYGNIVASYNSATGVMTLTSSGATASDAQWSHALAAVTFSASSSATPGNRTVSFTTNDGAKTSAVTTDTIDVLGPPTITTDSGSAPFVAGDNVTSAPVAIDSGVTLTDSGAPTLASATIALTGNFHSGEDVLAFTNTSSTTYGNITSSYDGATGVLTLTSAGNTATLAQWQSALQAVTYTDTAVTPNNATRTISFTAIDGNGTVSNMATRTVTVQDMDQTPVVTTTGITTSYIGGAAATVVDSGLALSDRDDATQSSATVSIGTGFHSGDTLAFANTNAAIYGNITASYNSGTGVLTLTSAGSTATDAQWQSALDAVTFSTRASAVPGNRTVSFVSNDGTENSLAATKTVNVIDPPLLTVDSGSASFVAGDNVASAPVVVDSGITVADAGSTTLASAAVSITGNFHSGEDVLAFANDGSTMGNIAGSYDGTTGILTLTSSGATATLAQWQAALASVTYTDTAITPDNTSRTISFNVVDGNGNNSNIATRDVTVQDTDQTPVVATTIGSASYTPGLAPTVVDTGIVISDRDNTTLASATVSVSSGFLPGDQLSLIPAGSAQYGNITVSYDAAKGVLTLNSAGATATLAQWQQALDAVQFATSPANPQSSRTISFTINDGTDASVAATRDVMFLTPPFAPPVASSSGALPSVADTGTSTVSHEPTKDIVITELDPHTTFAAASPAQIAVFSGNSLDGGLSGVSNSGTRTESGINVPTWLQPMSDWSATATTGPTVHLDAPSGQAFSLTLTPPAGHSDGLEPGTSITTTVEQLDGTPLPDWMHYDSATGVLSGIAPRGEPHEVAVVVIKHDGAGHVIRREIVVDFGRHATRDGHTGKQPQASMAAPDRTPPASKPSLAEQFARQRKTLHASRQHAPRPDRSA